MDFEKYDKLYEKYEQWSREFQVRDEQSQAFQSRLVGLSVRYFWDSVDAELADWEKHEDQD